MGYVNETLSSGEVVLYSGRVHWCVYIGPALLLLFGVVVFPPLTIIGLIWALMAFITQKTTEVAVTSKRVIAKFGFIRRHTIEQRLEKVDSIRVTQGVFSRIFGAGSLVIAGSGESATPVPFIANPMEFKRRVDSAIDAIGATMKAAS